MMKVDDATSLVIWLVCIRDNASEIERSQYQVELPKDSLVKVLNSYRIYKVRNTWAISSPIIRDQYGLFTHAQKVLLVVILI